MPKPSASVADVFLLVVQGAVAVGLISGTALALAIGKFMLGGVLAVASLGVYARFKRGRVRK